MEAEPSSAHRPLDDDDAIGSQEHDTVPNKQEVEVERLLSERLVDGFVLLEKACPACATPLVKNSKEKRKQLEPIPAGASGGDRDSSSGLVSVDSQSFEAPIRPIEGVPFCVWCQAHVVTDANEVLELEGVDHLKVRGSIMVAMSKESLEHDGSVTTLAPVIESLAEDKEDSGDDIINNNNNNKLGSSELSASSKENCVDHRHGLGRSSSISPRRAMSGGDDGIGIGDPPSKEGFGRQGDPSLKDKNKDSSDTCEDQSSLADSFKFCHGDGTKPMNINEYRAGQERGRTGLTLTYDKSEGNQHISLDDDDDDDDQRVVSAPMSPQEAVSRVESLLHDDDDDEEEDDCDESIEEIEVVHVEEESECSEMERKVIEQNSTTGMTTKAERLVLTVSEDGQHPSNIPVTPPGYAVDDANQSKASSSQQKSDQSRETRPSEASSSSNMQPPMLSSNQSTNASSKDRMNQRAHSKSPKRPNSTYSTTSSKSKNLSDQSRETRPSEASSSSNMQPPMLSSNQSTNASSKDRMNQRAHSESPKRPNSTYSTTSSKSKNSTGVASAGSEAMMQQQSHSTRASANTSSVLSSKSKEKSIAEASGVKEDDESLEPPPMPSGSGLSKTPAGSIDNNKSIADSSSKDASTTMLSYEERRQLATRVLGKKMAQGYNLTEQQCTICQMPLMEKKGNFFCVVCPAIREKVAKAKAGDNGTAWTPSHSSQNVSLRSVSTPRPGRISNFGNSDVSGRSKLPATSSKARSRRSVSTGHSRKGTNPSSPKSSRVKTGSNTLLERNTKQKSSVSNSRAARSRAKSKSSKMAKSAKLVSEKKSQTKTQTSHNSSSTTSNSRRLSNNTEVHIPNETASDSRPSSHHDEDISSKISSISESYVTTFSMESSVRDTSRYRAAATSKKPTLNTSNYLGAKKMEKTTGKSAEGGGEVSRHSSSKKKSKQPSGSKLSVRSTAKSNKTGKSGKESPVKSKTNTNPFSKNPVASLTPPVPPTAEKQNKIDEEAVRLFSEAEEAEKEINEIKSTGSIDDHEVRLNDTIRREQSIIRRETRRLEDLEKLLAAQKEKTSDIGSVSSLSNRSQRRLLEEENRLHSEIDQAKKAREEAEIEVRRLEDEKRTHRDTRLISDLEKEAEKKQKEAEEAMEKAKEAIEQVSSARQKMLAETIAEGEASAIAEAESIVRSQAEDYHERAILPSESDLHHERWDTLRAEGRSIMTRRVMAGWTVLPELCKGEECDGQPLLLDGSVKQCVVCGGTGTGGDGVYALPGQEEEEEVEHGEVEYVNAAEQAEPEHLPVFPRAKPPKEISTPRLDIRPPSPVRKNADHGRGSSPKLKSKKQQKPRATKKNDEEGSVVSKTSKTSLSVRAGLRHVANLQQNFESKRGMVTKEIGKRMMKGWNLLDSSCPYCVMPLMTDIDQQNEICVLCGIVGEMNNEKLTSKSIQTWTKGEKERVHTSYQLPTEESSKPAGVKRQKGLDAKEQRRLKKELLRELVIEETRKATARLEQAFKEKIMNEKAEPERTSHVQKIERKNNKSNTPKSSKPKGGKEPQGTGICQEAPRIVTAPGKTEKRDISPKKNIISPIHLLLSRGQRQHQSPRKDQSRGDPPAFGRAMRRTKAIDAEGSTCGLVAESQDDTSPESKDDTFPKSKDLKLDESESTGNQEVADQDEEDKKSVATSASAFTLRIPKDFDVNDETSLKQLIRKAKIQKETKKNAKIGGGQVPPRQTLGVDTKIDPNFRHPMVQPSPGMTEASIPGILPTPSSKSSISSAMRIVKKKSSADVSKKGTDNKPTHNRAPSPGLASIDKLVQQDDEETTSDSSTGSVNDPDIAIPIRIPKPGRKLIRPGKFPEGSRPDPSSGGRSTMSRPSPESRLLESSSSSRSRDAPGEGTRMDPYNLDAHNLESPQSSWVSSGSRPRITPESTIRPRRTGSSETSDPMDRKPRLPPAATESMPVSAFQALACMPGMMQVAPSVADDNREDIDDKSQSFEEQVPSQRPRKTSYDEKQAPPQIGRQLRKEELSEMPSILKSESCRSSVGQLSGRSTGHESPQEQGRQQGREERPTTSLTEQEDQRDQEMLDPILAGRKEKEGDSHDDKYGRSQIRSREAQANYEPLCVDDVCARSYRTTLERGYEFEDRSVNERTVRTLPGRTRDIETTKTTLQKIQYEHPLLVQGVVHENNKRVSNGRMIVVPGLEADPSLDGSSPEPEPSPVPAPKPPANCRKSRVEGKDVIVVEGGPFDQAKRNHQDMDSIITESVGTETLDQVLARIEETKKQLEMTPVTAQVGAKPEKLRQLIDNLAAAAAEIEKQDRIEMDMNMNICFPME